MSDEVWESEPSTGGGFLTWFAGGLGVLLVALFAFATVSCCGCTYGWSAFIRFGISEDLADFRISVRESDLPEAEKASFVGRLEVVEDRLDSGDLDMSFVQWVGVSADFEQVFQDRVVEVSERPLLEESMRAMER